MFLKLIEKKISYAIKRVTEFPLKQMFDQIVDQNLNQVILEPLGSQQCPQLLDRIAKAGLRHLH